MTWADWFDLDEGHAVYWIASTSPPEAVRARLAAELTAGSARVYSPSALAYDVRLGMYPDAKNVKTVYGLMSAPPTRLQSETNACGECKGTGSTRFERGCRCLPIDNAVGPSFKTR